MPQLLNADISNQIKSFLSPMKNRVEIVVFTKEEPCETCAETVQLMEEIGALSEKITVTQKDINQDLDDVSRYGITLTPSFVMLDSEGNYQGVKFNGIPAGHEINSFMSAIMDMSGLDFGFSAAIKDRIKKINKDVNIKVFVTLSCPHCPGAVQSAHRLAMLSKSIEGEMIEAQTFYELSDKYQVSGVPKIVINDTHELVGNQPVEAFLDVIERL